MVIHHITEFAGYPIVEWQSDTETIENPANSAIAIRVDWNYDNNTPNHWIEKFNQFISKPYAAQIPAFVVGYWGYGDSTPVVESIAANRDKLPRLEVIFVGDITSEELEISWIKQGDLSSLLKAFPNLKHFAARGGNGLQLGPIDMPHLKSLRIESGGLDREVVKSIAEAKLPELESLVLWLGTAHYGANTTLEDLKPFYTCSTMPQLTYLGLCDSDLTDAIAAFIATAPVLERLEVLDLSMGILSDEGGLALLTSPYIRQLKKLDLHHHFMSKEMMEKLRELNAFDVEVDLSDAQDPQREWRFVAVGE